MKKSLARARQFWRSPYNQGRSREGGEREEEGSLMRPAVEVSLQPAQGLRQVLQGVGVGEAEIPFASGPEINAGCDSYFGLLQNINSQGGRVFRQMAGVHEGIEGPRRRHRNVESQAAQPR